MGWFGFSCVFVLVYHILEGIAKNWGIKNIFKLKDDFFDLF